jgi:S1-C subfamily serine protease
MPAVHRTPLRSALPVIATIVLLAALIAVAVWRFWPALQRGVGIGDRETGGDATAAPRPIAAAGPLSPQEQATIDLFNHSKDSVVNVTTSKVFGAGVALKAQEVPQGSGTGFVWDEKGRIVTNAHVVRDANRIRVTLGDQSTWNVNQVSVDEDRDLAVLWTDAPAAKLKPLPIGESGKLQVGQRVYAIGNPFGLDQSLTNGIISAVGRSMESRTGRTIRGVIQTDAPINPGNSGGPLLDSHGRVIGVNAAILSASGSWAGIGFAIPIDEANRVVPRLIRYEKEVRPSLGISIAPDQVTRAKGIDGVLIMHVTPGGPAAKAGLRPTRRNDDGEIVLGDIIVAIGDHKVRNLDDLYAALETATVGQTVTVSVLRDDETQKVQVKLGPSVR